MIAISTSLMWYLLIQNDINIVRSFCVRWSAVLWCHSMSFNSDPWRIVFSYYAFTWYFCCWQDHNLSLKDIKIFIDTKQRHTTSHMIYEIDIFFLFSRVSLSACIGIWQWKLSWVILNCRDLLMKHISHNIRKCPLWHVRPTKTQLSQRIRAVWSESLLLA